MHVGAEGGGRRPVGEPAGLPHALGEREAESAELARDGHPQVAGLPQVLEVLLEEAVLAVVHGRSLVEAPQKLIREDRAGVAHRGAPFSKSASTDIRRGDYGSKGASDSIAPDGGTGRHPPARSRARRRRPGARDPARAPPGAGVPLRHEDVPRPGGREGRPAGHAARRWRAASATSAARRRSRRGSTRSPAASASRSGGAASSRRTPERSLDTDAAAEAAAARRSRPDARTKRSPAEQVEARARAGDRARSSRCTARCCCCATSRASRPPRSPRCSASSVAGRQEPPAPRAALGARAGRAAARDRAERGSARAREPAPTCSTLFSRHLEDEISADVCAEMERHLAGLRSLPGRVRLAQAHARALPHRRPCGRRFPAAVQASVRIAVRNFLAETA